MSIEVKGKDIAHVSVRSDNDTKLIEFKDILYVLVLRTNLISVKKVTNKEYEVTFRKEGAYIRDERGNISIIADAKGDLYCVRKNLHCAEPV